MWTHTEGWDVKHVLDETILVLDGGAETTRTVIGSMIRELALQPDQRHLLIDRPELLASTAVEEFIRWVSPISNMRRTATVDHELHGQQIHVGDELLLLYPAANRDPRAFTDPDVLDVTREHKRAGRVRLRYARLPGRAPGPARDPRDVRGIAAPDAATGSWSIPPSRRSCRPRSPARTTRSASGSRPALRTLEQTRRPATWLRGIRPRLEEASCPARRSRSPSSEPATSEARSAERSPVPAMRSASAPAGPRNRREAAGDTTARVSDIPSALGSAEVILLALPAGAVDAFISENGDALRDKLIVDATNQIGGDGPANAHAALSQVTSHYARAFNTLGWENFEDPHFGDVVADLFYSAPEGNRETMDTLISAVGLRPQYLGDGQHEVVDGLLRVWFALAIGQKRGRRLALRVLD